MTLRPTPTSRYLLLPVRNAAPKVVLHLLHQHEVVREFDLTLATDGEPDWWAFLDLAEFAGCDLVIQPAGDVAPAVSDSLDRLVRLSDSAVPEADLYRETWRPQFHFTSRRGWNNDPNGLVMLDGLYHLFYQHNPFGIGWGNMHWGHAVSRDLVTWEERPLALHQRGLKDMAFSGSGFVDRANTSGWQDGALPPLILAFTSTGRGECLAYSLDNGQSFHEAASNPVVRHQGRDPKVIWYEPGQKWVMVVYDETDSPGQYTFYDSTDLHQWRRLSSTPGFYECPDLFELPLSDGSGSRWVLHGAQRFQDGDRRVITCSSYLVGEFDGETFTPETEPILGHLGPGFYAAQTWSNLPDGRRVMIGWLRGADYPGMPFSQGLTVPLELALVATDDGPRLSFNPVEELTALRTDSTRAANLTAAEAAQHLAAADADLLDVELTLASGTQPWRLDLRGLPLAVDPASREVSLGEVSARAPGSGPLTLRLLVDRGVAEVFAADGLVAMAAGGRAFSRPDGPLGLSGDGQVERLAIHALRSIWT